MRLLPAVLAGAMLLGGALSSRVVLAAPAAPLLDALAWYSPAPPRLLDDPLAALARPVRGALDVEWAPLYRGPGGERIELGRETLHLGTRRGGWSAAAEADGRRMTLNGADGPLVARTEIPDERRLTAGVASTGPRHRMALVAGVGTSGHMDGAGAIELEVAPAWRTEGRFALESHRGGVRVEYDDAFGSGTGSWTDRRLTWRLDGVQGGVRVHAALEALDRVSLEDATFAHPLAWREERLAVSAPLAGADATLEFEHGSGSERFELLQGGVPYARVTTPLSSMRLALGLSSSASPVGIRMWSGRWSGAPDGTLRLWAFDGLAAMAGSRQVVRSDVSLSHAGLALDTRAGSRFEAGMATWWIRPRMSYESWLAPVMGVGRENVQSGELEIRSAWLAGARLAARTELIGLAWRIEVIQWAPLAIRRATTAADAPGDGSGGVATSSESNGATWGGTVLRFGVSAR